MNVMNEPNRRTRRNIKKEFRNGKPSKMGINWMIQHFDKIKPKIEKRIQGNLDKAGIPFIFDIKDKSFKVAPFFENRQEDLERIVKSSTSEVIDDFIKSKGDYKQVK